MCRKYNIIQSIIHKKKGICLVYHNIFPKSICVHLLCRILPTRQTSQQRKMSVFDTTNKEELLTIIQIGKEKTEEFMNKHAHFNHRSHIYDSFISQTFCFNRVTAYDMLCNTILAIRFECKKTCSEKATETIQKYELIYFRCQRYEKTHDTKYKIEFCVRSSSIGEDIDLDDSIDIFLEREQLPPLILIMNVHLHCNDCMKFEAFKEFLGNQLNQLRIAKHNNKSRTADIKCPQCVTNRPTIHCIGKILGGGSKGYYRAECYHPLCGHKWQFSRSTNEIKKVERKPSNKHTTPKNKYVSSKNNDITSIKNIDGYQYIKKRPRAYIIRPNCTKCNIPMSVHAGGGTKIKDKKNERIIVNVTRWRCIQCREIITPDDDMEKSLL